VTSGEHNTNALTISPNPASPIRAAFVLEGDAAGSGRYQHGAPRRTRKVDVCSLAAIALLGLGCCAASGCGWLETKVRAVYVSQDEFGERWPLTVSAGVLLCDQTVSAGGAVLFETGGERYALNETAKSLGYPPIDRVWKRTQPRSEFTRVDPVPEPDRRRAFRSLVECQDRDWSAERDKECYTAVAAQYRLSTDEMQQISVEGVSASWPPLTAGRVDIGPLVDHGLALCAR